MIRHAYSHALRGAMRAEIDKDLVKNPVHDIEKHLTGVELKQSVVAIVAGPPLRRCYGRRDSR